MMTCVKFAEDQTNSRNRFDMLMNKKLLGLKKVTGTVLYTSQNYNVPFFVLSHKTTESPAPNMHFFIVSSFILFFTKYI